MREFPRMSVSDHSIDKLKETIDKKTGSELIRELTKAIPSNDVHALELKLSKSDRDTLSRAVVELRLANDTTKAIASVGVVPRLVYQILGIENTDDLGAVAAAIGGKSSETDTSKDNAFSFDSHENSNPLGINSEPVPNFENMDMSKMVMTMFLNMQTMQAQNASTINMLAKKLSTTNSTADTEIVHNVQDSSHKNIAKEIYQALGKMPDDKIKIPEYFDVLETYFNQKSVPNDRQQWLDILKSLIGFHGNKIVLGLPVSGANYQEVKQAIFRHYGISAMLYYDKFHNKSKPHNVTYRAFTETLAEDFTRYLEFSKVEKTYQALFDQILHDRIMSTLPSSIKTLANQWSFHKKMDARELANFADQMAIDSKNLDSGKTSKFCSICKRNNHDTQEHRYKQNKEKSQSSGDSSDAESKVAWEEKCKKDSLCVGCGERYDKNHRGCQKRKEYMKSNSDGFWFKQQQQQQQSDTKSRIERKDDRRYVRRVEMNSDLLKLENNELCTEDSRKLVVQEAGNAQTTEAHNPEDQQSKVYRTVFEENILDQLPGPGSMEVPVSRNVTVNIDGNIIIALVDSGADVSVLRADCIKRNSSIDIGPTIILEGPFGETKEARLVTLSCSLQDHLTPSSTLSIPLNFAVCDSLRSEGLLLSLNDFNLLKKAQSDVISHSLVTSSTEIRNCLPDIKYQCNCSNHEQNLNVEFCDNCQYLSRLQLYNTISTNLVSTRSQEKSTEIVDNIESKSNVIENNIELDITETVEGSSVVVAENSSKLNSNVQSLSTCSVDELVKQQLEDKSLKVINEKAKSGDKTFFINEKNQLLYRRSYHRNVYREQLILPQQHRQKVVHQAHDMLFGGHFAKKKTRAKIEAYFWWPSIAKDVTYYVKTCETCQRKRNATVKDKIPIKFIPRGIQAFDVLVADLIGPVDESSQNHKWCLTVVDQFSRFPFVYPLKSLKPQEICQCFLQIFSTFGIPSQIVTDMGTNFTSQLNLEFSRLFGFEHELCIAGRKESTGLAERMNANIEKILHQILISDKKRNWPNLCPLIAWALRDAVNETTGLTPFEIVFGHNARSPMALLKDKYEGQGYNDLKKPYRDYMQELVQNLEAVAKISEVNCQFTQKRYQDNRNVGTVPKSFSVGDRVVILIPDSSFKIRSQWGLGTVLSKIGKNSYRVQVEETGQIRVLHVDKLRHFYSRINHLGVLLDSDDVVLNVDETDVDNVDIFQDLDLSHLDDDYRRRLLEVLYKHKNVFSNKTGICSVAEHIIETRDDFIPKQFSPYRFPQKLIPEIEKTILEMEKEGKIQKSNSQMVSPMLVVAKTNGIRIVIDYRYLNQYTEPQNFPIPRLDDMLSRIVDSELITCLDISSAYHTIPLRKSDQHLTAFVCHLGVYEYKVAPMGLRYSGCTFQKAINNLLMPHLNYAFSYVDDTSVYTKQFDDHLTRLDNVLTTYEDAGLTCSLSKCQFAKPKVRFLGFLAGSGTIAMLDSKVEAIDRIPLPTTKKAVRSFLGALNFYSKFIANFSALAKPLYDCVKQGAPNKFKLNDSQVKAFNSLKEALKSAPVLSAPDYDKEFIIQCDSSNYALGSVLMQYDDNEQLKPIAFASHKFSESELNWDIVSKEAFAVIFSLRHFQNIIFRCKIILYSDHNPLQFAATNVPKCAKLQRWALELQSYDITIKYIKTDENVTADWISRFTE